ncbi:hypothetical protein [Streptomyces sioyaensis]|uniref:hypothetical protein n=1 Tax=Streptomyces sioyaensis TaxID=67364 RepID=UPI003D73A1AF
MSTTTRVIRAAAVVLVLLLLLLLAAVLEAAEDSGDRNDGPCGWFALVAAPTVGQPRVSVPAGAKPRPAPPARPESPPRRTVVHPPTQRPTSRASVPSRPAPTKTAHKGRHGWFDVDLCG